MQTEIVSRAYAITAAQVGSAIVVSTAPLTIGNIITLVFSWLIYFVGVIAFIYLVYSGILYITAASNPDQAKKGQAGIINAIIGIIIVVLSYAILKAAVYLALGGSLI